CMSFLMPDLNAEGFDIVVEKEYPIGITDLSDVLLEVKSKKADAFIGLSWPEDTMLMVKQMQEISYDPKFMWYWIGPSYPSYVQAFGPAIDGTCMVSISAWCRGGPGPGSAEFYDAYTERWGHTPDMVDSSLTWASCEVWEQAIDKAGTLDWEKLTDAIYTETFTTIAGPAKFVGTRNVNAKEGVLQWQKGEIQIVWPPEVATAELMIPKPSWP
ncbi:ABC transporter substrate-binding protein, partial [Chloroflexota bacterium]